MKCDGNCTACTHRACQNKTVPVTQGYTLLRDDFTPRAGLGLAIDLGTTTIALELIDLQSGRAIAGCGFVNPQRKFGPDVISRIDAANQGHASALRRLICEAIDLHARELLQGRALTEAVIAGNTTMISLLLGFDCACLGKAPFEPETALQNSYPWPEIFGRSPESCILTPASCFIIPWISAFVGGDVVAGLVCAPCKGSALLVDLGTNGEIALRHAGRLYATATAAGPAFEGMKPGLCGSDVLEITAKLVREAHIDETGFLEHDKCYGFTQRDVRQVQLAKSAVRTGIEVLLDIAGRPELDAVYLCGGIGHALDEQDALDIGLFPAGMKGKIVPLGNAALGGAARLLKHPKAREEIPAMLAARHINLSEQPKFNEYFMEYINFE